MEVDNNIDRRGFLKLLRTAAAVAYFAPVISPLEILATKYNNSEENTPLIDLPVIVTENTPIYIENRYKNGHPIDIEDLSEGKKAIFGPDLMFGSGLVFDFLHEKIPRYDFTVPGYEEYIPWVVELPHVTGLQPPTTYAVVGYSEPDSEYMQYRSDFKLIESKRNSDIVATYGFTDQPRIYPAKIYNLLTAFASIMDYQKEHGPMMPGEDQSYLLMSGAPRRNADQYIVNGILDAGGICASVTTISKTNFIASHIGLTENILRFKHSEKFQYGENPGDPTITKENSDATVTFWPGNPDDWKYSGDYRFKILENSPPLYYSFNAQLLYDDNPLNPDHPARHVMQPADARLVFSVSLVKTNPLEKEDKISNLLKLRDEYASWHNFWDEYTSRGGFD